MTKTNAEILEEYDWKIGHNKHKQPCCNVVIGEIICEGHLNTLMDRARAEERKKLLLNNKDNKLNNQIIVNNKPKITREQWQKMTNAILNIDIKTPFTYKESFEITNDILEAMGLEVED